MYSPENMNDHDIGQAEEINRDCAYEMHYYGKRYREDPNEDNYYEERDNRIGAEVD